MPLVTAHESRRLTTHHAKLHLSGGFILCHVFQSHPQMRLLYCCLFFTCPQVPSQPSLGIFLFHQLFIRISQMAVGVSWGGNHTSGRLYGSLSYLHSAGLCHWALLKFNLDLELPASKSRYIGTGLAWPHDLIDLICLMMTVLDEWLLDVSCSLLGLTCFLQIIFQKAYNSPLNMPWPFSRTPGSFL